MTAMTAMTAPQRLLRWLVVACIAGALALALPVVWDLIAPAGAATPSAQQASGAGATQAGAQTGLSLWQALSIMGAGFALIMSALVGTWIWLDARFGRMEAKFDDRFKEADAKADARFERMEDKFDDRFKEVDARFERMEAKFDDKFKEVDARFERMEAKLERMEAKFDDKFKEVDARFERMEAKFDDRFKEVDARFERMEAKFDDRFKEVDARFERMEAKFERMDDKLNAIIMHLAGIKRGDDALRIQDQCPDEAL